MSDYADQTVAVLAVQGAFAEHEARLFELGAHCIELRQAADLKQDFDRLVLPGGESTVQGKLLDELGMLEELRTRIAEGMPVLGTCAGLILLAHDLAAHDDKGTPRLETMDVLVERNAYGRQLGSFRTKGQVAGIDGEVPLTFIRAPRIVEHQALAHALEQLHAQALLQLLQRGTGGRLGKRYGLCSRHRGPALGHCAEDLELTQGEMQHDDDSYIRIDDSRLAPAHPAHD